MNEITLKGLIVKFFNIKIKFRDNYSDLKMIIPKGIKLKDPMFLMLSKCDWVIESEYVNGRIIIMKEDTINPFISNYS